MPTNSIIQQIKVHNFGGDAIAADATLADVEWDMKGLGPCAVVFGTGIAFNSTAACAVASVHQSDTSGFTPGAGNLVKALLTTDLPQANDDSKSFIVDLPEGPLNGRYCQIIYTNGATDPADVFAYGIGIVEDSDGTASDRGAEIQVSA